MAEQPRQRLQPKHLAFVERYVTHFNGARAAREVGYSEKSARAIGSQLLADPLIRGAVDARLAELSMEAEEVHKRLTDDARADMSDFLTIKEKDYPLWSPKAGYRRGDVIERDEIVYKAIADNGPIRTRKQRKQNEAPDENDGVEAVDPATDSLGLYWQKTGREKYVVIDIVKGLEAGRGEQIRKAGLNKYGKLEVELVDAMAAKVHVGRIHKMFIDRVEVEEDDEAIAAAEELNAKLDDLRERLGRAGDKEGGV